MTDDIFLCCHADGENHCQKGISFPSVVHVDKRSATLSAIQCLGGELHAIQAQPQSLILSYISRKIEGGMLKSEIIFPG